MKEIKVREKIIDLIVYEYLKWLNKKINVNFIEKNDKVIL